MENFNLYLEKLKRIIFIDKLIYELLYSKIQLIRFRKKFPEYELKGSSAFFLGSVEDVNTYWNFIFHVFLCLKLFLANQN